MPTVLITGGPSGTGLVGAKTLVERYGCDLILGGSDLQRVERGAQQLRAQTGAKVDVFAMELASLQSVRQGQRHVRRSYKQAQRAMRRYGVSSAMPVRSPWLTARMALRKRFPLYEYGWDGEL